MDYKGGEYLEAFLFLSHWNNKVVRLVLKKHQQSLAFPPSPSWDLPVFYPFAPSKGLAPLSIKMLFLWNCDLIPHLSHVFYKTKHLAVFILSALHIFPCPCFQMSTQRGRSWGRGEAEVSEAVVQFFLSC